MLVAVLRRYPDELRADFQRFYGLNLDGMGTEYRVGHAASLVKPLLTMRESFVLRARNPDVEWDLYAQLLAGIADSQRWLVWSKTKDGSRNKNRPKPINRPGTRPKKDPEVVTTDIDEVKRRLALPRVAA